MIDEDDWRHPPLVVDSPPEFMAAALRHLDREHGGARALLRSHGLADAELDRLVDLLTEPVGGGSLMGRVGSSLQVNYPAEVVFRVATRVDQLPTWLPEVVAAELLDPTFTVGSRVRLKMGAAAAGAELIGTVRQLRAPSILAINGSAGPLTVDVRVRFDAVSPDATRIVLEIEVTASPLLGFLAREAERRINAELMKSLEQLRALVVARPGGACPKRQVPTPIRARSPAAGEGRRCRRRTPSAANEAPPRR